MNEIGLFCGTFNPIHLGHLLIAECARDQFALSKVLFVTSPTPPHRSTGLLPGEQRHQLVQAAIQGNTRFEASRLELDRGGTSYTVDTVEQVLAAHSEPTRVNLIIGGDNLPFLKDWHRSQELLTLCRLIVVPRLRYLSEAQAEAQVDHGLSSQNRNQNQSQTSGHSQPGISQPGISQPGISQVVKTIAQTQPAQHHTFDLGHEFKVVDFPGIAISSEATRRFPFAHYDMVRVGLYLYGLEPNTVSQDLHPALSVKARINHKSRIAKGQSVGYGWTWTADRDTDIASIPIGYADGIDRGLSNRMTGLLMGREIRQIGRISMDQMLFDVTDLPQAQEGDVITILGQDQRPGQSGADVAAASAQILLSSWAQTLDTITYELACRLRARLPRVYTRTRQRP